MLSTETGRKYTHVGQCKVQQRLYEIIAGNYDQLLWMVQSTELDS